MIFIELAERLEPYTSEREREREFRETRNSLFLSLSLSLVERINIGFEREERKRRRRRREEKEKKVTRAGIEPTAAAPSQPTRPDVSRSDHSAASKERERERESDLQLCYGRTVLLSCLKKVNLGGV